MNIEHELQSQIKKGVKYIFGYEITNEIGIQPTRKEFEGDYTFVILPYLKVIKKKPDPSAHALGEYLEKNSSIISGFNVIKGFLNLSLSEKFWINSLNDLICNNQLGRLAPTNKNVVVEYSSPNTNKPLHLGHLRNNFLGYSVSQILEAAGHNVIKINLVNDRGIHICKSMIAYEKFGEGETPESTGMKGDHLVGKYYIHFNQEYKKEVQVLKDQGYSEEEAKKKAPLLVGAQEMLRKWEEGNEHVVNLWKTMNQWVYQGFDETYKNMGVSFNHYYYESETYLLGKAMVDEGLRNGIFYKKENGSVWCDLSDEKLGEKLLLRDDDTSVYITQDMAAADLKFKDHHFNQSIYVVGNEQNYHFNALFKILKKMGKDYADDMHHLSYGMVDLPSGKMKSREGTVVDADDLITEMIAMVQYQTQKLGKIADFNKQQAKELYHTLALGALKYFLLKVDPKKRILFNPEKSIQLQGHTGSFVQYTHARINAIVRKAEELKINYSSVKADLSLQRAEIDLIALLNQYEGKIKEAANAYSPAMIANFVFDLAKEYNRFYAELPIFSEDNKEIIKLRVAISFVVAKVIKSATRLLGIEVPERM